MGNLLGCCQNIKNQQNDSFTYSQDSAYLNRRFAAMEGIKQDHSKKKKKKVGDLAINLALRDIKNQFGVKDTYATKQHFDTEEAYNQQFHQRTRNSSALIKDDQVLIGNSKGYLMSEGGDPITVQRLRLNQNKNGNVQSTYLLNTQADQPNTQRGEHENFLSYRSFFEQSTPKNGDNNSISIERQGSNQYTLGGQNQDNKSVASRGTHMQKVEGSCSEFEIERVSQESDFLNAELQNEINREQEDDELLGSIKHLSDEENDEQIEHEVGNVSNHQYSEKYSEHTNSSHFRQMTTQRETPFDNLPTPQGKDRKSFVKPAPLKEIEIEIEQNADSFGEINHNRQISQDINLHHTDERYRQSMKSEGLSQYRRNSKKRNLSKSFDQGDVDLIMTDKSPNYISVSVLNDAQIEEKRMFNLNILNPADHLTPRLPGEHQFHFSDNFDIEQEYANRVVSDAELTPQKINLEDNQDSFVDEF